MFLACIIGLTVYAVYNGNLLFLNGLFWSFFV